MARPLAPRATGLGVAEPPSSWRPGLRAQLAAVLGVVLIPAVACSIWLAYGAYREHGARLSATLRSSAAVISAYEEELLGEAEATLRRMLAEPVIAAFAEPGCSRQLADEQRHEASFLSLGRFDGEGTVRCASIPDLVGASYADRKWFAAIRDGTRSFVVSEVIFGRMLKRPTVVVALRVPDTPGSIAASMDIRAFAPVGDRGALVDTNSSVVLVDNEGRALIEPRDGEADQSLTIPPRDKTMAALNDVDATFEAVGLDGVRRLYALAPVADGGLNVVLGTPIGGGWDWLEGRAPIVLAPIALLLLAVLAIWVATNHLVSRHIRALSVATRRWSHGHGQAWPALQGAPAELAELGATFSEMAERIALREGELHASLSQKEVLLKEIHHRVKNNLQIVSSLLNLRARAGHNAEVRKALEEVQTRIKALALVHRNLYEQEEPTSVDLERFLVELCQMFGESGPAADAVEICAEVQPGRASADKATPIALLVTECITNALRHGFPDGRRGTIVVRLERIGDRARLSIADDGVGRGDVEDDGTGLTLCRLLAKQIGGELQISGPPGTTISVSFSERGAGGRSVNSTLPSGNPAPTSNVVHDDGTS